MDFLLGDLRFHDVYVYIDDILIHDENEDRCLELVEVVFSRLQK